MNALRHLLAWGLFAAAAVILAPGLLSPAAAELRIERWQAQLESGFGPAASAQTAERAAALGSHPAHRLMVMRALIATAWLPVLLPFWLAALVQGWAWRRGRQEVFAQANPRLYLAGVHLSIALAGGGLLALLSPIDLPLAAIPLWGALVTLCISGACMHRPAWRG